jgi:MraZ protein
LVSEGTVEPFLGEYPHSLDAKGRLILPAKFRAPLEAGAVIGMGKKGCLAVYTPSEWERVAKSAQEMAREDDEKLSASRAFFALAQPVAPDKQGRVAIAPHLREYADLQREVIVAGALNRIEIWNATRWREERSQGEAILASPASLPGFGI